MATPYDAGAAKFISSIGELDDTARFAQELSPILQRYPANVTSGVMASCVVYASVVNEYPKTELFYLISTLYAKYEAHLRAGPLP